MTDWLILYVSGLEVASLGVAFVLASLAYRGYRKSGSKSFIMTAVGFTLLGCASLAEGVLYQFGGFGLDEAHAVRSTLTLVGLAVLLYSIYKTK